MTFAPGWQGFAQKPSCVCPKKRNAPGERKFRFDYITILVGVRGFEPPTPASRTQYSTRLSYTPNNTRELANLSGIYNPC